MTPNTILLTKGGGREGAKERESIPLLKSHLHLGALGVFLVLGGAASRRPKNPSAEFEGEKTIPSPPPGKFSPDKFGRTQTS